MKSLSGAKLACRFSLFFGDSTADFFFLFFDMLVDEYCVWYMCHQQWQAEFKPTRGIVVYTDVENAGTAIWPPDGGQTENPKIKLIPSDETCFLGFFRFGTHLTP